MVTDSGSVMPSVGGGQLGTVPACVGSTIIAAPSEGLQAQQRRPGENRRSNKPIMEKRRRARINNCLNELKTLILDAMKKDPARHSKLEKADILEMTVKHLETLQRQQVAMSAATDPSVVNKFRAGFNECAGEVGRFPGLDSPVRRRLLQHLANCLNGTPAPSSTSSSSSQDSTSSSSVQVHILPNPEPPGQNQQPKQQQQQHQGIFFSTSINAGGLQLVPTRLPNGDIALVLPSGTTHFRTTSPSPSTSSNSCSPLPMLIPIPQRTASTASASSTSSCTSPVAFERLTVRSPTTAASHVGTNNNNPLPPSYEEEEGPVSPQYQGGYEERRAYSPPMQKPLALVMRKRCEEVSSDDERPWRPW